MKSGRNDDGKRLGEILLDEGLIADEQLRIALEEHKKSGGLLGEILVEMGAVSERDIARAITAQISYPYISVFNHYISKDMLALFPEGYLWEHQFLPLDRFLHILTVVCSNVLGDKVIAEIEQMTGCKVKLFVSSSSEIRAALATYCPDQANKALDQVFPEVTKKAGHGSAFAVDVQDATTESREEKAPAKKPLTPQIEIPSPVPESS